MPIFVIGDLHLSLGTDKPMDIFKGWQNYVQILEENWKKSICSQDIVVLAGDISWAMKLEECCEDFAFIHNLPGKKILLKGNHDYWWTTKSKMEDYIGKMKFNSLFILFNNCIITQSAALCGTRGWLQDEGEVHDVKMMQREAGRLRSSLAQAQSKAPELEKIVFLHYPPVFTQGESTQLTDAMQEYGVRRCFYGHIHGPAVKGAVQGKHKGIVYQLASADALKFTPLKII